MLKFEQLRFVFGFSMANFSKKNEGQFERITRSFVTLP